MQLRWTRRAVGALDRIGSFIAVENPQAAGRVVGRIRDAVQLLGDHPYAGRDGRVRGTRELIVPDYPYIVAYRVTAQSVEILTVMHAFRRWPQAF